jgi:hypothetical protein
VVVKSEQNIAKLKLGKDNKSARDVDISEPTPDPPQVTGKRTREKDKNSYDLRDRKVARAFAVQEQRISIPSTYKQAVNDPVFAADWQEAMERELTALRANETWEQVVPPERANIVSSK